MRPGGTASPLPAAEGIQGEERPQPPESLTQAQGVQNVPTVQPGGLEGGVPLPAALHQMLSSEGTALMLYA